MRHKKKVSREIFDKIEEIANLSAVGGCLYRGEPEHYEKVSSALYRERQRAIQKAGLESELIDFDVEAVQKEILDQVKRFIPPNEGTQDFSVLTQLQHYGSPTNLIDFTTDFHIALFFACDSQREKDGRVIVQRRDFVPTEEPSEPRHRVTTQRSVFVRPKQGYIDPNEAKYELVNIPSNLKASMLEYLRNNHGISTETLYNDIHGYIRNRGIHESAYSEFYIAWTCQKMADEKPTENQELWHKAIAYYKRAIELDPDFVDAYTNLGMVYKSKKDYELALENYERAIELDPSFASAYCHRGILYADKGELERAIRDFNNAIERDPSLVNAYYHRGTVYGQTGELERAIRDFNSVIKRDPGDGSVYYHRGIALSDLQRPDEAAADFEKALLLNPNNTDALIGLGRVHFQKSQQEPLVPETKPEQNVDTASNVPLSVTMENGETIAEPRGIYTFLKVIEMLEIERVKPLGIIAVQNRNLPLISDYEDPEHAQKPLGPYYVAAGNSTPQKKKWLNEIAARLGVEMTVIANPKTRR